MLMSRSFKVAKKDSYLLFFFVLFFFFAVPRRIHHISKNAVSEFPRSSTSLMTRRRNSIAHEPNENAGVGGRTGVVPFPRYRHRWFSLLPGKFFYGSKKLCQVFRNIYEPCERYEDKTRLHAFAMANGHGVLSRHVPPRCLLAIFYISERLRLLCWDAHRIREYTTMKLASKQRKTKMVTRPLCNVQSFFRSLWSLASLKNYRPPMCFTDRFARNTVWKILFCVIIGYSCSSCLNSS